MELVLFIGRHPVLLWTTVLLLMATLAQVILVSRGRGLHDRVARTEVVYRLEPKPPHHRSPSGVRRGATTSRPAVSKAEPRP